MLGVGSKVIVSAGIYGQWLDSLPKNELPWSWSDRAKLIDCWGWMQHIFVVVQLSQEMAVIRANNVVKRVPTNSLILFGEEI